MTQTSKLLDDQVVEKAKTQLRKVGKTALMTRKLEAIISAKKHGISQVAQIYDITRKTLTSWIKCVRNDSLDGLSAPTARKRKRQKNRRAVYLSPPERTLDVPGKCIQVLTWVLINYGLVTPPRAC